MPDLFDFFKENESKLYEAPSDQAWKRIEKKLERRKLGLRREIPFLQPGTVALILVFLLFTAIIVYYFVKHGTK
ncbi:MAG: hypothetical protein KGS48_08455 [Bacteroidetes bacterium]|nr:hypothetical protein [Bacteroidota bacterium]